MQQRPRLLLITGAVVVLIVIVAISTLNQNEPEPIPTATTTSQSETQPTGETPTRDDMTAVVEGTAQDFLEAGKSALDARDYERAVEELKQAIQLNDNLTEAHFRLGNAYLQMQRHTNAEAAYRDALLIEPNDADVHANLGVALYSQNRFAEAEGSFRTGLQLSPSDAELHYLLGATLLQLSQHESGQLESAKQELDQAIELKPDMPEAWYGLGVYYKETGQTEQAIQAFEHFLELPDPQDIQARSEAQRELDELRSP